MKNSINILLVEDNPADVELTLEALSLDKVTNHIDVVKDGVECMEFLRQQGRFKDAKRPCLILLDLNMPRMNGLEVLAQIKQDPTLCNIPTVILTTSKEERDIAQSYKLQANCYVGKPVDLQQFRDVVKAINHFWFDVVCLPQQK